MLSSSGSLWCDIFFFFKQKTAYEMRISDWSSDVCSSDLVIFEPGERYRLRNLTKHQLVKGTVHPYRGEWIEFDVEQKPGKDPTAGTRVARKRRLSLFVLMRALGYGDDHCPGFLEAFVREFSFLEGQWEKERDLAPTQEEARSEEHTSELQSLMRISYAVFCL